MHFGPKQNSRWNVETWFGEAKEWTEEGDEEKIRYEVKSSRWEYRILMTGVDFPTLITVSH